ncbi:MAG: two-component sensor histidine kinase [Desulfobacteraceae bacterium]|nr:two-component sensor histidine kinase [Desulfobacteraceae bacterium]
MKSKDTNKHSINLYARLGWLVVARLLLVLLLIASATYSRYFEKEEVAETYLSSFYLLIGVILFLTLGYAIIVRKNIKIIISTYLQLAIDTVIVSLIILTTGGYYSIFSFLYLVVIIYANMIFFMSGGLFIAAFGSAQYVLILIMQYVSKTPNILVFHQNLIVQNETWQQIIYKCLITNAACFAVAFLSGLLTEQNRKTQKELKAMEANIKRVEKLAYMGEMAAGLAHEIKNPLASLVGSIQLLQEDIRLDSDHQRLMEIILRETDRLSTLVSEFLIFARPPTAKPEMLEIESSLEEIIDFFKKDTTHAYKFIIEKDLNADSRILMDPTHLRQVMWNLLLNAADAIKENGKIRVNTFAMKNNCVRIQVCDNGCGMPAEVLNSIFDPFFTTKSEGTGLGLSIVHRILGTYDSRLDVESREDDGTIFSFVLQGIDLPSYAAAGHGA